MEEVTEDRVKEIISEAVDKKLKLLVARFGELPKQANQACPITEIIIRVGSAEQVRIAGGWEPCPPVSCGCHWEPEYPYLDEDTTALAMLIQDEIKVTKSELFQAIAHKAIERNFADEIRRYADELKIELPVDGA